MNVDTSALNRGVRNLKNHCRTMEEFRRALEYNMRIAHEDFADPIYDRAAEIVESVQYSLRAMSDRIERVENGLKKLERCVERYNETGYRG